MYVDYGQFSRVDNISKLRLIKCHHSDVCFVGEIGRVPCSCCSMFDSTNDAIYYSIFLPIFSFSLFFFNRDTSTNEWARGDLVPVHFGKTFGMTTNNSTIPTQNRESSSSNIIRLTCRPVSIQCQIDRNPIFDLGSWIPSAL